MNHQTTAARLLAVMAVFLVATTGCHKPTPERDLSERLIGHWKTIDGKEEYYVTPTEITAYFHKEDRLTSSDYIILQQYPNSRTIEFRVQTQGANDYREINDRKLVFSDDYKVAEAYVKIDLSEILGPDKDRTPEYHSAGTWRYVDDARHP